MRSVFSIALISLACAIQAQKTIVKLEVDQKKVTLGKAIVITIRSNVEGEITIDLPSEFVRGYDVMSGMEQEVDYNTGIVNTISYYAQNGSFKKVGTFTLGPAYVKKGKHVYKSNTVQVTVQKEAIDNSNGTITSKQLKQVAFGVIEVNKTTLFEGEPLVVQAKVYARFAPTSIEDYQSYSIDQGIDKHSLDDNQSITAKKESVKGSTLYAINYDRNLIFPSGGGTLQLNPFKLILRQHFDGVAVVSTGTNVTVKPLPDGAPKSFIGMVGQLDAACRYDGTCDKKGEVIKLELVLSGKGNLHNIEAPKLKFSKGLIQFGKPEATEEYSFTGNGAEGKVIFKYTLQSTNDQVKSIDEIPISYFDPTKETYVTLKLDGFKSTELTNNKTVRKKGSTTIIKNKDKTNEQHQLPKNKNVIPWGMLSLFSVLSLAGIGLYFIRKKPSLDPHESQATPVMASALNTYNKEDILNAFDDAYASANFSQIERSIFELLYLSLAPNKTVPLNKALLLDCLKTKNEAHHELVSSWHHKIQYINYGLNVEGTSQVELLDQSKQVSDLILTHYSTS